MLSTGGKEVEEAVASIVALLRPAAGPGLGGHQRRSGGLELSGDCGARGQRSRRVRGQLAGRAQSRYVPFDITIDGREGGLDPADNEGILDVITTTGALLTAAIRTAPRDARGFHPYPFRSANREGFAAMGIAEVLLHAHDMAEGLGVPYEAPAHLAEFVLTRIFPTVQPRPDHWQNLLWATGRADLRRTPAFPAATGSPSGAGPTTSSSTPNASAWRASPRPPPPTWPRAAPAASTGSRAAPSRARVTPPGW